MGLPIGVRATTLLLLGHDLKRRRLVEPWVTLLPSPNQIGRRTIWDEVLAHAERLALVSVIVSGSAPPTTTASNVSYARHTRFPGATLDSRYAC
jgi:hypothetical protein